MPSRIRELAEDITLADLLNSPSMASDALSVISNILNNSWMYSDLQTPDDISLERDLFTISQAYGYEARHQAFSHLRDRRQLIKRRNDHEPSRATDSTDQGAETHHQTLRRGSQGPYGHS
jgi:hypothetical protein